MSKHVPKFTSEDQRLRAEIQHSKFKNEHLLLAETLEIDTPEKDPDVVLKDGVWVDVDHSDKGKG